LNKPGVDLSRGVRQEGWAATANELRAPEVELELFRSHQPPRVGDIRGLNETYERKSLRFSGTDD